MVISTRYRFVGRPATLLAVTTTLGICCGDKARNTEKGGDRRTPSAGTVPPYYTSRGLPEISLIDRQKIFVASGHLRESPLIAVLGPFIFVIKPKRRRVAALQIAE